jgi:hypothetical protein
MKLTLAASAALVLLLSSGPGMAIETVTLPQNSDGTTDFQNPDGQTQDKYSTDQSDSKKTDSLGSFHFSASSGNGWPNDPGYYYRPGSSSAAGYGSANVPGSEFYNSGYPFPH